MVDLSSDFIPYGRQTVEEDDIQAVVGVLRSNYLTTGPKVPEFESRLAEYVGAPQAVAYSSGTAALHGAMAAAGIGPGDEVLVPTLSFLATANAAYYVGAKPIFVDSVPGGFNMDVKDARRKITSRTERLFLYILLANRWIWRPFMRLPENINFSSSKMRHTRSAPRSNPNRSVRSPI